MWHTISRPGRRDNGRSGGAKIEGNDAVSIQADQLVYDYLSRVGDAAHGVLSPTQRLRFVSALRARIDAERANAENQSIALVRQLLNRLGDPETLVRAEASRGPDVPQARGVPTEVAPRTLRASMPAPRQGAGAAAGTHEHADMPSVPVEPTADEDARGADTAVVALDQHGDEQTPSRGGSDIFDVPAVPIDDEAPTRPSLEDTLPGIGGSAIPPISDQTPGPRPLAAPTVQIAPAPLPPDAPLLYPDRDLAEPTPVRQSRRWAPAALAGQVDAGFIAGHKREVLAALLLFAGGVFSSIVVVAIGYAVALASATWSARDKRFALIGLPALTILVFVIGLWLQATGRWGGAPLAGARLSGQLRELVAIFPRVIGLLGALFLSWRLARLGVRR